jgi:hypothetical protein
MIEMTLAEAKALTVRFSQMVGPSFKLSADAAVPSLHWFILVLYGEGYRIEGPDPAPRIGSPSFLPGEPGDCQDSRRPGVENQGEKPEPQGATTTKGK